MGNAEKVERACFGERVAECLAGLDETRVEASIDCRDCVREGIAIGPFYRRAHGDFDSRLQIVDVLDACP